MLDYNIKQKKRASTLVSLALSEIEASEKLVESKLHREAVVHMYFCCFYLSQAFLVKQLGSKASHKNVEVQLNKTYSRNSKFPNRYVMLHRTLHALRNTYHYNVTHSPVPRLIEQKLSVLRAFVTYALKLIPTVAVIDLLEFFAEENKGVIRDFSYDIYCPKTYSHHTRLTVWQPPFYLKIFSVNQLQSQSRRLLQNIRVTSPNEYVVGLNSRLDQYVGNHLLMLDIDSIDSAVEEHLSKIGGFLFKSGRGFHFIGSTIICGQKAWEKKMRAIRRDRELKPYLDIDHIDISLKRGYSTLRVTTSKEKPQAPIFFKDL